MSNLNPPTTTKTSSKVKSLETTPSTDASSFRAALHKARRIVVVAGAGLSAASGIPTFRGAGGLWREHDATQLATPEAFEKDPVLVWQFYEYRRRMVLDAKPNDAHRLLARLSDPTELHRVAPNAASYHLITQNVDGLSPRALEEYNSQRSQHSVATNSSSPQGPSNSEPTDTLPGSELESSTLEMHGRVLEIRCTSPTCTWSEINTNSSLFPSDSYGEGEPRLTPSQLPHCPTCGCLARPGVVWFDERPRHTLHIEKLIKEADFCISIGTSSTVFPAAGYVYKVRRHGGTTAIFNLEADQARDRFADFLFVGKCEDVMRDVFGLDG